MTRAVQNRLLHFGIFCLLFGSLLGGGFAFAHQEQSPAPSAEVQKDLEVLGLKAQLTQATKQVSDLQAAVGVCQSQLGPLQFEQNRQALQAEQRSIIEKYEKANPGFTLDPATGKSVTKPEPEMPKLSVVPAIGKPKG